MLLGKIEVEVLEGWRLREKESGLIMPWYTWPCLEWLSGLDLWGKSIFEYGVGDSTAWYCRRTEHVYGVDSDPEWARKNHAECTRDENPYIYMAHFCGGRYKPSGEIISRAWDIIVIDGIYRDQCTEQALKVLKPGGYLIIDNYKQPSVEEHWPLTEKLIEGMPIAIYKQPGHYDWQTAVITKP